MADLYGAKGGSANSDLYTIDPVTAAQTSVGPIGFAVTGLAFDPTTGTLYGLTSQLSPSGSGNSLITVNPLTGAGTLIAAISGLGGDRIPDIAFDSTGQLYGWRENSDNGICKINKATAVGTTIGATPGFGTFGDGFDIRRSDGVCYAYPGGGNSTSFPGAPYGVQYTVNLTTGVLTAGPTITGGAITDNPAVAAAAFDNTDVLWQILNDFPATSLVTIDVATGVTTDIGALANGFDALAWSLSSAVITLTPTSGLAGSSVSVDGTGFTPSSSLTATFNGSPVALGGTTSTDGAGAFTGSTFTVPALAPGTYTVRFDDGTVNASKPFTITPANTSCANAQVITGLTGCVTSGNVGVTSSGPDPLNDLLGTGGGHAVWFKWTAPPLGPNGLDVTFTITAAMPAIGHINAAILRGACGGQVIPQNNPGTQVTLAPSTNLFTGRTAGSVRTLTGIGTAASTTFGSYVQNSGLPVTLTAHVASGETIYVEIDNYDGTAQGAFEICVNLDTHPVLTFRNYWRAEQ